MNKENIVETDVLVIGGGLAGCFAAVKAKEEGANVVLVDKGYVGKSGSSPFAGDTMVFNPEWGHDFDAWMKQFITVGEYLNNREWCEIVLNESYDRFKDLQSWGVKFQEEDGKVKSLPHPLSTIDLPDQDKFPPLVSEIVHWLPGWPKKLRKAVKKSGTKLMERIMICELIKQEDQIVGAIGLPVDGDEPVVFKAKAVIIAAGCDGLRPIGYPTHPLSGDSVTLGYNVGAQVIGQEFVKPILPMGLEPRPGWKSMYELFQGGHSASQPGVIEKLTQPQTNAEGNVIPRRGVSWACWLDVHHEVHEGRGPIKGTGPHGHPVTVNGPGAAGQSMQAGLFATDTDCSVGVKGLYAAGDSLGTQYIGASYCAFSFASAYANVTGARAGVAAAQFATTQIEPVLNEQQVERMKKATTEPLNRKGGFCPRWVTEILRSYMNPYFVMYIKHEKRLQAALMNVEFIRDHLVPKMVANDPHELRIANETKNLVQVAEMKLRASMFRKESRGHHYREDYPQRNDPEWLAWVLLKDVDGEMEASKKMIPEAWWPDQTKQHSEIYPMELPESC